MTHKTSILAAAIVLLPIALSGGDAFCDSLAVPSARPMDRPARTVYCLDEIDMLGCDLPPLNTLDRPASGPDATTSVESVGRLSPASPSSR